MVDPKKQREHLRAYTAAARAMELHEVAITVLEGAATIEAARAIILLKRAQVRQLNLLDAAAAKLGAPYPSSGSQEKRNG
jgi:hypothetical protein